MDIAEQKKIANELIEKYIMGEIYYRELNDKIKALPDAVEVLLDKFVWLPS